MGSVPSPRTITNALKIPGSAGGYHQSKGARFWRFGDNEDPVIRRAGSLFSCESKGLPHAGVIISYHRAPRNQLLAENGDPPIPAAQVAPFDCFAFPGGELSKRDERRGLVLQLLSKPD